MNSGNDDQRWRSPSQQQRGQGQRRNMPRDSYNGGQGYNNNQSNGNTNSWGMNANANHQQQGAGYYEHHVPVNGFDTKEAMDLLTRGYEVQLQAARGADADKPVIYKGDKGWIQSTSKGSGNAWGQKRNAMASGSDFLVQLKKSSQAFSSAAGSPAH
ncbi:hypothetical protein FPQ18DRAFT_342264 [Pyronema domesticum]|nr:hypothetical protein FPQ18DRAFT_342264 [Pyronema domesticum]